MFATINGTKLFYDVDGAGVVVRDGELVEKPVVFVIHGGPGGSHLSFKSHLDDLTRGAQLVYVDQRGCGFSAEGDPDTYTFRQNVEDLETLRKHLGVEKVWILGHSYGGMVAMQYALTYQENLAGLLLVTTSPSYRFMEKAKKFIEENGNEDQQYYANKLWNGDFQSEEELQKYYEAMSPLYSVTAQRNEAANGKKVNAKRSYQALNKGFGGFLRTYDIVDQLPMIKVPTLIIAGRHDWITPVSENESIHEGIPNSKFHILEDSSHSVFVDQHEETLSLIREFLGACHHPNFVE
ncbi:alpha/beta fold hydrolase [Oceanobacillus halotolerans]|uniref:alpha/beta fold hydrolase n=1 Tax=Oceanobacillus halotolerans TaxID=2663380 RepID=UPI0013D9463E|nr:alpha/beta fold hydrolase [Oceanobacillus halotolerans]